MKKLFEKIDLQIYLCQLIYELLKVTTDPQKTLAAPQTEYISLQQVADKCFVKLRQAERWLTEKKIEPTVYFGAAPYFSTTYIEEVLGSGKLRRRRF